MLMNFVMHRIRKKGQQRRQRDDEKARPTKEHYNAKPQNERTKPQGEYGKTEKPQSPSKPKQHYMNPNAAKPSKPAKRSGGTLSLKK